MGWSEVEKGRVSWSEVEQGWSEVEEGYNKVGMR